MRFPRRTYLLLLALGCVWSLVKGEDVEPVRPRYGEPAAPTQFVNPDLLIDTERLSVLLGDGKTPPGASLVVIDARPQEQYAREHIVGAFHLDSDSFQNGDRRPYGLADAPNVAEFSQRFGITPETKVVVYDGDASRLAARVWFTFWAYGHNQVCILEGGWDKWKDERRAVSDAAATAPSKAGTWRPAEQLRSVCTLDGLRKLIVPREPGRFPATLILDARTNAEYSGQDVRGRLGGHVPGAISLPWDVMLRPVVARTPSAERKGYFMWRDPAEIYALLRAAGLQPRQPLAVYDQSGGRSAHLLFTLYLMGFTQATNYNAGWREYGSLEDAQVER